MLFALLTRMFTNLRFLIVEIEKQKGNTVMTISRIETSLTDMAFSGKLIDKDVCLATMAEQGINIAQFVSFFPAGSDEEIRFIRTQTCSMNYPKMPIEEAIGILMQTAIDKTLNIRTFTPTQHQGNPFIYEIESAEEVVAKVKELTAAGYYVIAHETIDVNDGGVSGVISHDHVECAPGHTPRLVENCPGGAAVFTTDEFSQVLDVIYGDMVKFEWEKFTSKVDTEHDRIEFSIHPRRLGLFAKNYLAWEVAAEKWDSDVANTLRSKTKQWPNALSRLIGDKAYGLLMADTVLRLIPMVASLVGRLAIPKTTVFCKHPAVGIFQFGDNTGTRNVWTRTCPKEQIPGKHPTFRQWTDPYRLLFDDALSGGELASCIVQDEVAAVYSGAAFVNTKDELVFEYVNGYGDDFMQGASAPKNIEVLQSGLLSLPYPVPGQFAGESLFHFLLPVIWKEINYVLGKSHDDVARFRMEWAFDGHTFWILQFHVGDTGSCGNVIVPGEPKNEWLTFCCKQGLETLRQLVSHAKENGNGIRIHGDVGMTSHIADVCRKAKIPSIIKPK